ncbi:hypothetical protein [Elizabethkingia anophelis]|uniref:hypothetical protein n=1 Tax=Elizabethkingia anophelis TaxID=1117645 RepID=UPI003891776D
MIGNLFEEKYQSITWTMEIEKTFPSWKSKEILLNELKECRQKYSSVQCEDHFGESERLNRISILNKLINKYETKV